MYFQYNTAFYVNLTYRSILYVLHFKALSISLMVYLFYSIISLRELFYHKYTYEYNNLYNLNRIIYIYRPKNQFKFIVVSNIYVMGAYFNI